MINLVWLALAAIALWAMIRLGRQTERKGRRHWRVAATLLSAVCVAGGVLSLAKGGWVLGCGLTAAGLWLALSSRQPSHRSAGEPETNASLGEAEALSILGLRRGADPAAIQAAWRRQMARVHPDQGGTEGLAARLNAARDYLLKGR